jgi:hypothetical protein
MATRNVYEVQFEAMTQEEFAGNHKKTGAPGWSREEPIHVFANGTVMAAVSKAEQFLLARVEKYQNEEGVPMLLRTLKVRVTSCERIVTLDA